jgi:hypothetical protein
MKFEIKKIFTKKRIVIGIALAVLIILAVGLFGVYKNKKIKQQLTQEGFTQDYKNPSLTNAKSESDWQAYQNSAFSYSLNYPKDWHIFADDADTTALTEVDLGNGEKAKQGSSVFWSNKDSIEYAEESRPQDFRLVGMIMYEKTDTDIDQLAVSLGFTQEVGTQSFVFQAGNLIGKEYLSLGTTDSSPRSAIIFKNSDQFYVFHLAFTENDQDSLRTMEEIVGTFRLDE